MIHTETYPPVAQACPPTAALKQRRILILNWRDISHPRAGGAEKVTHEIARRWAAWGHHVTLFCAAYPGGARQEFIDGVQVVRRGRQHTVHWHGYRRYAAHVCGRYDLIVDEVNTIPFFAPLYAREPVIMYSNQLARDVWRYEAAWPLSTLGYVAEPLYLQAYRRTPIMTISRSTKQDLRGLGLHGPCYLIPMSVDTQAPVTLPPLETKEDSMTLAFVGRVVPSKRVDHIIRALDILRRNGIPDAQLWIVGSLDEAYRRQLDRLIACRGLARCVTFWSRVDDPIKERLLARAHVLVMTSVREGWGLVVTEANVLGTPAVVYDVPGLRDSTCDGETGIVCKHNTPQALARAIAVLHSDRALYGRLRERAWATARRLSWDRTARAAWDAVEACL